MENFWTESLQDVISAPAWAERYRPRRFADLIGLEDARAYLSDQARRKSGRSVLIYGPPGCGKSCLGDIYASALLCQRGNGEPCLEPDCWDCRDSAERDHCNWIHEGRQELDDEGSLIRAIRSDVRSEASGGGWKIITIDQAHRLSGALDRLHGLFEHPPPRVTFILCTTDIQKISERAQSLFHPIAVSWAGIPARLSVVETICRGEALAIAPDVAELLVRKAGGGLRRVARDIEALASGGEITRNRVLDYYVRGTWEAAERWVQALLAGGDPSSQHQALITWEASSGAKVGAIEAYFASLFSTDILHLPGEGEAAEKLDARRVVVTALAERAKQLGMEPRQFWRSIIKFWAPSGQITEAGLIAKADEFSEILNGPTGALVPLPGTLMLRQRRTVKSTWAAGRLGAKGRGQARSKPSDVHLSYGEVQEIWEAGSSLTQAYGLCLNAYFTLRYDRLELTDSEVIAPFLTSLLHEIGMIIKGRARARGCPHLEPFHYIYVHETDPVLGRCTQVALAVPWEAADVLKDWLQTKLRRDRGHPIPADAVTVEQGASGGGEQAFGRHLVLMRRLCRGIDPTVTVLLADKRAVRPLLVDVVDVPPEQRRSIGARFGAQRTRSSRLLGPKARALRSECDLPILSIFEACRWDAIATGWEFAEHQYRHELQVQRERAEASVRSDWPDNSELTAARREIELERLRAAWKADAEFRRQNRPGFGGLPITHE